MDPISVTASAIAFATAVKDLVELGRKIHESFAKVSRNRRNAQRTADNIMDMIEEIGVFCENNKDTMANMKEFTVAIERLLEKLRDFETSILPLIPQRRGFWKSVSFLRGWWDNNKIEDGILDLERDIREARRRYMLRSAMRAEVKLEVVHQDTTRGLADITYGLDIVRRDVSAIRVSTPATAIAPTILGTSNERERNVMLFVQSAMSKSASLLRPPDEVTEEMMTIVFIKSQFTFIAASVERLATLRVSEPSDTQSFCVSMDNAPTVETSRLGRNIVQDMIRLRNILSEAERLQTIPINGATGNLGRLSLDFSTMGLMDEAIQIGTWAVRLARALVDGSATDRANLAYSLHLLSRVLYQHGDMTRAQQLLEESFSITQALLSPDCVDTATDTGIRELHGASLIFYAMFTDNQHAIKLTFESIRHFEDILGVHAFSRGNVHATPSAVMCAVDVVERILSSSPDLDVVERLAGAFDDLVVYLCRAGGAACAKHLAHVSITLRRQMMTAYGQEHQHGFACALARLISLRSLAQCFTDTELLCMVDECALLFRQLAHKSPVYYSHQLLSMLRTKIEIHQRMQRDADSISTWEEIVSLTVSIVHDSKLQAEPLFQLARRLFNANRYLDAAHAMARIPAMLRDESHASLYGHLSRGLLKRRLYKESAEAATNSIAIFRKLGVERLDLEVQWTSGHVHALWALAQSLVMLGNDAQEIHVLGEAINIAANVLTPSLNSAPTGLETYCWPFEVARLIDKPINNNMGIYLLERLATRHPHNKEIFVTLSLAQISYAYHLYCMGRLRDIIHYTNEWIDNWVSKPDFVSDSARILANMMWIKAKTLNAQGRVLDALLCTQSLQTTHEISFDKFHILMPLVDKVQLEVNLERWDRALDIGEEALERSRSDPGSFQCRRISSLFAVAYAALHGRNYQRTMEVAVEGIDLSADPEWQANAGEADISIRPRLLAIMSSAVAINGGGLGPGIHYARQAVVSSLDIAERKCDISATTAKESLMETRGYLAEVLLASRHYKEARDICEERREYFFERVKDRMGEYRDLAPILRMLGVLYCHEKDHEQGEAAARELTELIIRLGIVFPSLQDQIKIRLRYQASNPILKVLDEETEKLRCDHQKGIKALFEV